MKGWILILVFLLAGTTLHGQPKATTVKGPVFAYYKTKCFAHEAVVADIHDAFLTVNHQLSSDQELRPAHIVETNLLGQTHDSQLITISKLPVEITHIIIPKLELLPGNSGYDVTILVLVRDSIDRNIAILKQSKAPEYFRATVVADNISKWAKGIRQELTFYKRNYDRPKRFKDTWISIDVDASDPMLRDDIRNDVYDLLSRDLLTTYVDCCGQVPDPKLLHRVEDKDSDITIRILMNGKRRSIPTVHDAIDQKSNSFLIEKYSAVVLVPLKDYIEKH